MINVSSEFAKLMNERTDFKEYAEVTLATGPMLYLTEDDFTVSNNSVTDGAESNGIPLGLAIGRSVQIEIMNDRDQYSEYDFIGARIRLYLTFELSETTERIEYGTFTVITPETYGTTIIITAVDDMHKADKDYSPNITFPATINSMYVDICDTMGVVPGTTAFNNDDFVVNEKPEGLTIRQALGYIAMIAGGNARIDRLGLMQIISYDFENLSNIYSTVINGGRFQPWSEGDSISGGTFSPWSYGDVISGGVFGDRDNFHVLGYWSNLKVDTDDIVITGLSTTVEEENAGNELLYGAEGYVLAIENPLIAGQEQEALELIGNIMIGGRFRQFSGDLVANPTCEFMDPALIIDIKGNVYVSFLTDVNFQFFGFTSVKNSATPTLRNSAKTYSETTKALVKAKKLVEKERTAREVAVEQLANTLAKSSGLYMTEEKQGDGSVIYYMHDKSTLKDSMIVWKLTALAFAVSTDGGNTYPYGFTVDGTTITRLLYAEGINADYINTGALSIKGEDGTELFRADYDTKSVLINADNVLIGSKTVKSYVDSSAESAVNSANSSTDKKLTSYSTTSEVNALISKGLDEIRLEVTERTSLYNEEVNGFQGGMDGNINLSFFDSSKGDDGLTDAKVVDDMYGKQCINTGYSLTQSISIPAGTYNFSYEWLRNDYPRINAFVTLFDITDGELNLFYDKSLGMEFPDPQDEWVAETFQFELERTSRIMLDIKFYPPTDYPDRENSLYLTNIALHGTAQSVADAIADVNAQLLIQSGELALKVSTDDIINSINISTEGIVIDANKIDLVGLVEADELVAKFATVTALNAVSASVDSLSVNKASVTALNALSATVNSLSVNKLDANQFTAETISALGITVQSAKVTGGFDASKITSGTISADRISADTIVAKLAGRLVSAATVSCGNLVFQSSTLSLKTANVINSSGNIVQIKYLGV